MIVALPDGRREDSILQVSEISGGITNILWKLQPGGDGKQEPVVLRIFGEQTDKIIDRDQEERVLGPLNRAGFGAQVISSPCSRHILVAGQHVRAVQLMHLALRQHHVSLRTE
jgi:thiamine kinase-like enzyme